MPKCKWRECDARPDSDEALYEHMCSAHYDGTGDQAECRWKGCSVRPKGGQHYVFKHLITLGPPPHDARADREGHMSLASCNGKWFRPQNFSRHLRSAHSPSWYKPFACTATGCGRTFKELGAMRQHVGYAHEGGNLKRKRKRGSGVKMEVEDEWLSALSEDEETLDDPPAKRPRWPREPSFDSESEDLRTSRQPERVPASLRLLSSFWATLDRLHRKDCSGKLTAKRVVELEGALKKQSIRLQVAEKKIKTLQKQLAVAKATKTVAETPSGSTAAKMEQHDVAPGELEQDEWTMWVHGVM
ncbi:hypothetical protein EXIGLDRAFT_698736 [Exidia glandulosa HHB12029]|uniref:C2H2-type domain-containing protein n=1 Tax=Exidia glandulosa HHB12029 TaxID=1314781 RepID=A0A165E513_EXIGL|nr:hypothetical protein EXIGLDRAFT_698736 [Exidia glandulosa HHB12029]